MRRMQPVLFGCTLLCNQVLPRHVCVCSGDEFSLQADSYKHNKDSRGTLGAMIHVFIKGSCVLITLVGLTPHGSGDPPFFFPPLGIRLHLCKHE